MKNTMAETGWGGDIASVENAFSIALEMNDTCN